jgi:hypothetical protein
MRVALKALIIVSASLTETMIKAALKLNRPTTSPNARSALP